MTENGVQLGSELMSFTVLGPVRGAQGVTELNLGPARQRAVLALLLLRSGGTVTIPEIIDGVWGEDVPASGVGLVHVYLSRLRRALGSGLICRSVGGYRLQLDERQLDLWAFGRAAAEAERRGRAGDLEGSAIAWREGLALWRGAPLAGVTGPFAELHRQRLAELHLASLEDCWNVELALGRHRQIVSDLSMAVQEHPLRERFVGLLMIALYRCGRQAEALAVFDGTSRTLAEELSVVPGPELQRLRSRILGADHDLRTGAPSGCVVPLRT